MIISAISLILKVILMLKSNYSVHDIYRKVIGCSIQILNIIITQKNNSDIYSVYVFRVYFLTVKKWRLQSILILSSSFLYFLSFFLYLYCKLSQTKQHGMSIEYIFNISLSYIMLLMHFNF